MDDKTRLLVGLSSVNFLPCFDHYYDKALAVRLSREDIVKAMELGGRMKKGADPARAVGVG